MFLSLTLRRAVRPRAGCRPGSRAALDRRNRTTLSVTPLEGRLCPSGGYLLVGSMDTNSVLRYDETTGAFVDQFDPHNLANLKTPTAGVFGRDGNLYVCSGIFQTSPNGENVVQYNGTTGAFQTVFASQNIIGTRSVLFGPDGDLYVADANPNTDADASVERFDGKTGAFLNYFVSPSNNGGLVSPSFMVFGPDGKKDGKLDLYVAAHHEGAVYRYDGTTGAFKGIFVSAGSGGLDSPFGMAFGTDGNLYVASGNWFTSSNGPLNSGDFPAGAVMRYHGPNAAKPGTPDPAQNQSGAVFVPPPKPGTSGLANPNGLLFGPDGDLYVASSALSGNGGVSIAEPGTSQVLRYDGTTGASLGTFVTPDSGGLKSATFLAFTETDPTSLNYDGTTSAARVLRSHSAIRTRLAPVLASPPSDSTNVGPTTDSVALPVPLPAGAAAGATSPAVAFSPTPLFVLWLTRNLPAADHADSLQPARVSEAAADPAFASLDAELSLALFVDDVALTRRN